MWHTQGGTEQLYTGHGGKCEGMKSHQRLRCRWENNIKMDLKRKKMGGHGLDSSSQGR